MPEVYHTRSPQAVTPATSNSNTRSHKRHLETAAFRVRVKISQMTNLSQKWEQKRLIIGELKVVRNPPNVCFKLSRFKEQWRHRSFWGYKSLKPGIPSKTWSQFAKELLMETASFGWCLSLRYPYLLSLRWTMPLRVCVGCQTSLLEVHVSISKVKFSLHSIQGTNQKRWSQFLYKGQMQPPMHR